MTLAHEIPAAHPVGRTCGAGGGILRSAARLSFCRIVRHDEWSGNIQELPIG